MLLFLLFFAHWNVDVECCGVFEVSEESLLSDFVKVVSVVPRYVVLLDESAHREPSKDSMELELELELIRSIVVEQYQQFRVASYLHILCVVAALSAG